MLHDALDRTILARAISPFHDNDELAVVGNDVSLKFHEFDLQVIEVAIVAFLLEFFVFGHGITIRQNIRLVTTLAGKALVLKGLSAPLGALFLADCPKLGGFGLKTPYVTTS